MARLIQSGPRVTKIVVVGEAPGAQEDSSGVPFCGASGTDEHCGLNTVLAQVNIQRENVFVTNVVHERPPNNDFDKFLRPKPSLALMQGIIQLKKDIEEIKPNLVIAMGAVPLRFLTGKIGIEKWRGSILESILVPKQKVIGTYHPASVFRVWENLAMIRKDMQRIAEEAKTSELDLPTRLITIWGENLTYVMVGNTVTGTVPCPDGGIALAAEIYNAPCKAVDVECGQRPDGSWELACVGFSDRPDRALVVPWRTSGAVTIITRICASEGEKVLQNEQFDIFVLQDAGIPLAGATWDTMNAHHTLLMESASGDDEIRRLKGGKAPINPLRKGLGFQVSIYTRQPFYKDDGKVWKLTGDLGMFYRYNGLDNCCQREIRDVQHKEMSDWGVMPAFQFKMRMMPLLMKLTRKGVLIDMQSRADMTKQYTDQMFNLQAFVDGQAGGSLNVKSPKAMQAFLYETLKLPVKNKRRKDGSMTPTADKDAIIELAAKYGHPVLMAMLEVRKRRDLIERYLNVGVDADGRMRCQFDPTGTRTGRLASRQNLYGTGTNLQNIPEKLRRMFVADVGKVLFYVDLSQAEARVVAWLARCESLIELFTSGRDIHKENAVRFFGEYTEDKRVSVKRIVHGSNYGEGVDKILTVAAADGIRLTRNEVMLGQQAYFMLYPEIKEVWWKEVREALRYDRTLTTPLGWKRQFFGRWSDERFLFQAYSFQPQSTVGVLAQMAMLDIDEKIPDAELLLNEHDAVLGQCDEDKASIVVPQVVKAMQIPIQIHGRELVIPADAKVGKNWGPYDKETNPNGLQKWH